MPRECYDRGPKRIFLRKIQLKISGMDHALEEEEGAHLTRGNCTRDADAQRCAGGGGGGGHWKEVSGAAATAVTGGWTAVAVAVRRLGRNVILQPLTDLRKTQ